MTRRLSLCVGCLLAWIALLGCARTPARPQASTVVNRPSLPGPATTNRSSRAAEADLVPPPFVPPPITRPAVSQASPGRIVLVLDATGSMMSSFDALRIDARGILSRLTPSQSFNIVWINEHDAPPLSPTMLPVTPDNKRKAMEYVDTMSPRGSTVTLPALRQAFDFKPDLIYFMVDPTDFPDKRQLFDLARDRGGHGQIRVNVTAYQGANDPESMGFCKALADVTGGTFLPPNSNREP